MTPLKAWTLENGAGSARWLAVEVGVTVHVIYNALAGKTRFSHEVAVLVSKKTGIPLRDLPYSRVILNDPPEVG